MVQLTGVAAFVLWRQMLHKESTRIKLNDGSLESLTEVGIDEKIGGAVSHYEQVADIDKDGDKSTLVELIRYSPFEYVKDDAKTSASEELGNDTDEHYVT